MQIIINEEDLPITVAEKLITAVKDIDNELEKAGNKIVGGDGTQDFFTIDELKEICSYITVYCNHNKI